MKKWIFLFLSIFVPQLVCGAEVTQEILDRLGFYETVQASLLKNDTPWKCGVIEGKVIQYKISGDILGYNTNNGEWLRLITPMSTDLPVTALGLFVGSDGAVKRQVAVMRTCTQQQKKSMESSKIEVAPSTDVGEQMLSKSVSVPEMQEVVVIEAPVRREREVTEKNNIDVANVASTWELMAIYQSQMEEGR